MNKFGSYSIDVGLIGLASTQKALGIKIAAWQSIQVQGP